MSRSLVASFKKIQDGPCPGTMHPLRLSLHRDPLTFKWDETFKCDDCGRLYTLTTGVDKFGTIRTLSCENPQNSLNVALRLTFA